MRARGDQREEATKRQCSPSPPVVRPWREAFGVGPSLTCSLPLRRANFAAAAARTRIARVEPRADRRQNANHA